MEIVNKIFAIFVICLIVVVVLLIYLDPNLLGNTGSTTIIAITSAFIALLALATSYFTFVLISKQTTFIKKQTAILQKQALVWQNKENPKLDASNLKFSGNAIEFTIKNIGRDSAYWIGLVVDMWPVRLIEFDNQQDFSIAPRWKFFDSTKKKTVIIIRYVNFISHILKKKIVLKRNNSISFKFEPKFGARIDDKSKWPWPYSVTLDALVKILTENRTPLFLIRFSAACKNIIEEAQMEEEIDEFIFVIGKHKTFEDAYKDHIHLSLRQIPVAEMELSEGMEYKQYELKSGLNANPYEEEREF